MSADFGRVPVTATEFWEIGWTYGYQGRTVAEMYESLAREVVVPGWALAQVESGHREGVRNRAEEQADKAERDRNPQPPTDPSEIPF